MKVLIQLIVVILFTSCSRIIMTAYGIKSPKMVDSEKVERAYEKFGLQSDYSLAITDSGYLEYVKDGQKINKLFIYTQDGELVVPKDTNSCSSASLEFIDVFKDSNFIHLVDTTSRNAFHPYFRNLDGTPCVIENNKPYTAVVFWALWAGRLNKNLSAKWVEKLNKDEDVTVVCVSLDMRDFWPNSEKYEKVRTSYSSERRN